MYIHILFFSTITNNLNNTVGPALLECLIKLRCPHDVVCKCYMYNNHAALGYPQIVEPKS